MRAEPTERAEVDGFEDMYLAGAVVRRVGGAMCGAFPALPAATLLNRALGLGLESPATDTDLDAMGGFFAGLVVRFQVALAPQARPSDLPERLAARGFTPGYAWTKFRRGVEPPDPVETELRVERIGAEHAGAFARTFVAGYGVPHSLGTWLARLPGRPGWHCYIAFDGEEPAATGALYVRDGLGWLGLGATLPEYRRRGAQNAMLAARIHDAPALGVRTLVTETGVPEEGRPSNSHRNILRSGFTIAYVRPNYLSPDAADPHPI